MVMLIFNKSILIIIKKKKPVKLSKMSWVCNVCVTCVRERENVCVFINNNYIK